MHDLKQYSDELRTLVGECIRVDPDKRPDAKHVHETAKDMFKEYVDLKRCLKCKFDVDTLTCEI